MNITKTILKNYTINATPERWDAKDNEARHATYADAVSLAFKNQGIDGFTITEAKGYWNGKPEKSYIITVATEKDASAIEKACEFLRYQYQQEAVMLTYPDGTVVFIEE